MREEDRPGIRPDRYSGSSREKQRGERVSEALATRIREIAVRALSPSQRAKSNLYMDPWTVPEATALGPSFERWRVERESVLCFADHEPRANFAHPCSYYLHDARTGELVRRVAARFPPYPNEGIHLLDLFHEGTRPVEIPPRPEPGASTLDGRMNSLLSAEAALGRRYAILFAGESDPRHLNDFELYLRTLVKSFGFAREDIFVLFHDGTSHGAPFLDKQRQPRTWPGASAPPDNAFTLVPDGKGSREAFNAVLGKLQLQPDDLLFIHTEGHGGVQFGDGGGQYLWTVLDGPNSTDRYFSFEMQSDLQQLAPCQSVLAVMNHCFSGGFGDAILAGSKAQRTFFAAACGADGLAWATADLRWNEFSRNWIDAALQPHVPGTDDNDDGKVDASEAYEYCVDANLAISGSDSPVFARMPLPDAAGHSPADQISLV